MDFFKQPFKLGFKGKLYENLADPGSTFFGGAGESNSLGQKRDEKKGAIDWFGSPITAGTDSQDYARLAAVLYGAAMGGSAMAAGSAGGAGSTSATAAPTAGSAAAGSSPGWMQYARMGGNAMNGMQQKQPYQPKSEMYDDGTQNMLLLEALRGYQG